METGQVDPGRQFEHLYLRNGPLPASGRSTNWVTGHPEFGVSVYDANDHGAPRVPPDGARAAEDLHDRLRSKDPWYVVSGHEAGVGHDGEPVIDHPTVVGRWHPDLKVVH